MLAKIQRYIDGQTDDYGNVEICVDSLLSEIEDLGMLPPPHLRKLNDRTSEYIRLWEPEDDV